MALTYSLIYTPTVSTNYNAKYVCSDGKVHIRFKDYNKSQLIKGFEGKLTYLISFLFHKSDCENISQFMKLNDIWVLEQYLVEGISKYSSYKYKGLKLLKNYNKKLNLSEYGEIDDDCFPKKDKNISNLQKFMDSFKLDNLTNFLFDDSYEVIIHRKKDEKDNKFIRKQNRIKEKESELFVLW